MSIAAESTLLVKTNEKGEYLFLIFNKLHLALLDKHLKSTQIAKAPQKKIVDKNFPEKN